MGFINWLFGLFRGAQKKKPEKRALSAEALSKELGALADSAGQELQKKAVVKFSEIKHLLREIESELREIEKITPETGEGNPKLRRMAATAKQNFVVQMQAMSGKLRPPPASDLNALRNYCTTSLQLLQSEIIKSRKSIVLAGFAAREPVKRIGAHMNELAQALTEVSGGLGPGAKAFAAPELKGELSRLQGLLSRQKDAESEISELNSRKDSLSAERAGLGRALASLGKSAEYAEFASLKQELEGIEIEKGGIKSMLASKISEVEKPLHRMLQLSSSGKVALTDAERSILKNYLAAPMAAARQDPKAEVLKKLLALQSELVENSTISLKDREKEKCLQAASQLMGFDFFTNIFWKLNGADSRRLAVEKKMSALEITDKISAANSRIAAAGRLAEDVEKAISQKQAELRKLKSETEQLAKGISAKASEITGHETELAL